MVLFFEEITSRFLISNTKFEVGSKPSNLLFGHSHAALTYDDEIIKDFVNFAESGEAYFYTYNKVSLLLKNNKSVKKVFIEFSNNSIDEKMNSWIWGNETMSFRLEKYAPVISLKEKMFLLSKNPFCFIQTYSVILKSRITKISNGVMTYDRNLGGYNPKVERDKNNEFAEQEINFKDYEISEANLLYLDKIINICRQYDVEIILIRSPQRKDYEYWQNENEFKKVLSERFGDVKFLDFGNFKLDEKDYLDASHLNIEGARKFSKWFDSNVVNCRRTINSSDF